MNNWVEYALISVINRTMLLVSLNGFSGELYTLQELVSVRFSVVNECEGSLLVTFLLGGWEEIGYNRDLHTLISWWTHSVNEK